MYKKIFTSILAVAMILSLINFKTVNADSCFDVEIIFARGSGGGLNDSADYLNFKETIENKIKNLKISYNFTDLDYPAIGVGLDNLSIAVGAFISGGEAYDFGDSVNIGVQKLINTVNNNICKNTQFILGGYSQGAMVISKALNRLNPEKIIYAATFGDPKLYLPEGEGIYPDACTGKNLSDYRAYVPECYAKEGLLGGYNPYQNENFIGKLGTWCNKHDIMCSRFLNINDHLNYISDELYEDASRTIYNKIVENMNLEKTFYAPHDTAFLLDTTGSMSGMIDYYKSEALRLAEETINASGRIALYEYRDLNDPFDIVEHCNFENCTLEKFKSELNKIEVDGGGDEPESLLSASLNAMQKLQWKNGVVKSLIILTDAGYHSPDIDNTTFADVVSLSKRIDPVNFYIITSDSKIDEYRDLAKETDGKVVSISDELSLLTDQIIERYDSLPKVEEKENILETSTVKITNIEIKNNSEILINLETDADSLIISLNDKILGITNETKNLNLTDLNLNIDNKILVTPVKNGFVGTSTEHNIYRTPLMPNTGKV